MLSYDSIEDLVNSAKEEGLKISDICIRDQVQELEISEKDLLARMEEAFDVMVESTEQGADSFLRSTSGLTGGEGRLLLDYADKKGGPAGPFFSRVIGRAMATSNCNAAMGRIVATPTAGSCGILPGVLVSLYKDEGIEKDRIVRSIFTAAAFGMVIANRASISGAEGGCQAECGSASAMAAAALTELEGGDPDMVAAAFGMSLINQLGLVCDPVAGLVEIPCIKRNASGAAIALTSASMALAGVKLYIPADECIEAMKNVGRSMCTSLKETAMGGLAATKTALQLKKQVFGDD